ncbi:CapA family protein [Myxacorys almedinensis]|uniref:CapA family protein n=1 Tax=Myxacorys almedinensis A TaxID=2690445 RepID=A0A8J8CJN3_9CYAN|nr:CapA family protein [Myxacorys almedinensis]NDJ15710.1 CapA family protein [Myxacorys almedinensis A]
MSYAVHQDQSSVVELARSGNFRAIAYWLNVFLMPHNLRAQVGAAKQAGHLQVVVEFRPLPHLDAKSPAFRKSLVRFVCRHLWQLNSDVIEGVQIAARPIHKPSVLWRQPVRVVSPARRAKLARQQPTERLSQTQDFHSGDFTALRTRIQKITLQNVQFRALRSLLLTGTTAAAFIVGCWLGYADAPTDQTTASASITASRPDTVTIAARQGVQAESESVPITQLDGNPASPEENVTLLFGGDVALTKGYADLVKDDHQWAFSAMDEYRQADVAMVNLGAPFTTSAEPDGADPATVEVLNSGGVDIVNVSDRRTADPTADPSAAGLEETLTTLDKAGIHYVGAGQVSAGQVPGTTANAGNRLKIVDVKGQRIAYLGYSEADLQADEAKASVEDAPQHDGSELGKAYRVAADIQAIRPQVDWIIVNYHWGKNLAKYPADWQIELAHTTIDQGADVVVGHHSHLLQGAEIYKGRPIVYSLGNFIFGENASTDYDTAVLKVGVKDQQMKVELLPVEVKGLQPRVVSGDRAQEILHQVENVSDMFAQPLRSPMVLDARANTILSQPAEPPSDPRLPTAAPHATPTDAAPSSPTETQDVPTEEQPEPTFDQPTLEQPIDSTTPTPFIDRESGTPISPDAQSSPSGSSASPSSLDTFPSANPAETQPSSTPEALDSNPTDSPSEFSAPADAIPTSPLPSATPEPSVDNPFISNPDAGADSHSPAPMVPQQPEPTYGEPASDLPGGADAVESGSAPTLTPPPTRSPRSLEPGKRRYAEVPSDVEIAQNP